MKDRSGHDAEDEHTCPYAVDIHGDEETKCGCCRECEQRCADDI